MLNKSHLYNVDIHKFNDDYIPLNEYPRPNLVRPDYLILNGFWDFEIKDNEIIPTTFNQKILVPYAVESPLSFAHKLVEPTDYLIYQKKVEIPSSYKGNNIVLHFNGVDQEAKVYVDNKLMIEHKGISKFEVIIPFKKIFTITVIVRDYTDQKYYARGKQTLKPSGWFYSSSSGITKTVWLEVVNSNYVKSINYYQDYDNKSIKLIVNTPVDEECALYINKDKYKIITNKLAVIKLNDFHPWSNKDPYLYNVKIKLKDDEVTSYFGVRKVEIKEINGYKKLFLNNKPIFINGLLDQGYYYLGDLTPNDYQDYELEIKKFKALGFNTLRVHAKVEEDMFYYLADKYGMLLIQDFVNGGYPYNFLHVVLPRIFRKLNYKHINESKTGRGDKLSKECFINEANYYLDNFRNYPSVIIYTIFNENWGEFDPNNIYKLMKDKEKDRLFDTASGWLDADSDFYSIHTYTLPSKKRIDKKHRAFFISECGGLGLKVNDHSLFKGYFSHKSSKDIEGLTNKYSYLYLNQLLPQIKERGLMGIIYTQVSDCEAEYNGLYTFDRKVFKIDENIIKDINNKIYTEFNESNK